MTYIDKGHKIREDCYPLVSGFFLTVVKYVFFPLVDMLISYVENMLM